MMKRLPEWVINPLLCFASLGFCFFILEIGCRVFPMTDYDELRINDPYYYIETIGQVRHHIPYYTYREQVPLRFDTRFYYAQKNGIVCFHSNQFGARWVEPKHQNVGESIVLLLGDSFVYGHGLHYEDTFVYRLQRNLEERGHRISLLNFAKRGSDSREVLDTYMQFEGSIHHDAVLYGLHINDLVNFSTSSAITNLLAVPWLVKRSRGFEFMVEGIENHWFRKYKIGRMTSSSRFAKHYFADNMNAVVMLHEAANENGVPLYIVVFPILLDLRKGTFSSLYAGIRERLEDRGLEYFDLTGCLKGYDDEDVWILPFDQHPNEEANAVFSAELFDRFRRRGVPRGISKMRAAYAGERG
jgi:hypothetical protein